MSRNHRSKDKPIRRADYAPAFPTIATKEASDTLSLKPVYFRGVQYPHHFQIHVSESDHLELGQVIGSSQLSDDYDLIWGGRKAGIIQVDRLGDRVLKFTDKERQVERDEHPYVVLLILLRTIIEETQ